jgi:hypothetical protein
MIGTGGKTGKQKDLSFRKMGDSRRTNAKSPTTYSEDAGQRTCMPAEQGFPEYIPAKPSVMRKG